MIDRWTGLSWKLRLGVALAFLLISTVLFFAGTFWPWGWAVGAVMLPFSFPNDAEKKGYHDFWGRAFARTATGSRLARVPDFVDTIATSASIRWGNLATPSRPRPPVPQPRILDAGMEQRP